MSKLQDDWCSALRYSGLLHADRRGFAWEWLRRHEPYQQAWMHRMRPAMDFGLLAYEDPDHGLPQAKPIWADAVDPAVLASRPCLAKALSAGDLLDVRRISDFVSVEIDQYDDEHWLITDGRWSIRLDLHDGTLLGGPVLLEHHLRGFASAEPKVHALRQLAALTAEGRIPAGLLPREHRAARWILELRTADAMLSGATHQEMAEVFYRSAARQPAWRSENHSLRLRVQRLVRTARRNLADPLGGPWFRRRITR